MRNSTKTCRTDPRRPLALLAVLLVVAQATAWAGPPPEKLQRLLINAQGFLRKQQNADGSFGEVQPHLQTSLAILALLSLKSPPDPADLAVIEKAVAYLEADSSPQGDLGDKVFRTESHAIASVVLMCALENIRSAELRPKVARKLYRALRYTQRIQDRSSIPPSRGGWKMEGTSGRLNDRRASAWALLSFFAAGQYGLDVDQSRIERGVRFFMGSFKPEEEESRESGKGEQMGGFSVDAQGLAVVSISSMGGWVLARFDQDESARKKNFDWLVKHPAVWSGPNYFYTNFFRIRALRFSDKTGAEYDRAFRRLFAQIGDRQQPNGSVAFPPGNAQNTVAMGPVFSTSLAILILNVGNSRLPFDEDYRIRPLF